MPLFIRIEAVGLQEVALVGLQQHAVMHDLALNAQALPPPPLDNSIPPPPMPFLTPTLVLS